MSKIFSTFFLLIINFIIKFPFFLSELSEHTVQEYYGGLKINGNNENSENKETNDCLCDIDLNSCDNFCCCDNDCHEDAIKDWRDHHQCIDEKDSIGIFSDRCIDHNLIMSYARKNRRRGLNIESQTEDVPDKKATIENFCYSIDNSKKMTKGNKFDYNENDINFTKINEYISNLTEDNSNNNNENNLIRNLEYINQSISNNYINISQNLTLLFGSTCQQSKKAEMLVSESYSCFMNKNNKDENKQFINESYLSNMSINNINCSINKRYSIVNGLLKTKSPETTTKCDKDIAEVEYIIIMEEKKYLIKNCFINIVCLDSIDKEYIFKNSIKFAKDNEKLPYRYSGNGGYLNNYPLKICDNANCFNEYFIVGKDKDSDGNCRDDDNLKDYLYFSDVPIYFNQDYSYSCKIVDPSDPSKIKETTLYKKIHNITKIGKYGSSSNKNAGNSEDWISLNKNENTYNNEDIIIMNIYIGTYQTGYYSHKYIHEAELVYEKNPEQNWEQNSEKYLSFKVKFIDLDGREDNNKIYNRQPSLPTFVPSIPEDILDPLIKSEVDK